MCILVGINATMPNGRMCMFPGSVRITRGEYAKKGGNMHLLWESAYLHLRVHIALEICME